MLIADLSRSVAGAFCARLLSQRGDRVVTVGDLFAPDHMIKTSAFWTDAYLRSGIEKLGDPALVDDLVRNADVILTGWDAGRPTHDLDIRALNPDAVEVAISSFGTYGPYAALRGSPLVDWASGGYLYITGFPEREPLEGPESLPAYVAGYIAASAVEIGLRLRLSGAAGASLDVSTMEAMASAHQTTFSNFAATGEIKTRHHHAQPIHPLDIIECADGWVSVGVVTDAQYDALAGVIGNPQLMVDPRFATGQDRYKHADEFDSLVRDWFLARTADQVVDTLQAHQVPAVKMTDELSILRDPQLRHRNYWIDWTDGTRRGVMPGSPIRTRAACLPAASNRPSPSLKSGELPLSGTLVVDFTDYWAGPMATRILADLGASVVRVERPGSRFHAHRVGPYSDWKMNRGKRSIALDIKTAGGREVLGDLVHRAYVFVENFRPGVVGRLGVAYEDVVKENPGLVYLSLSGFGQDGPRASWASFGPILEGASSIQARTRYEGATPVLLGHSLPDAVGGFVGVFAALNALRARSLTGGGAYIDVSQLEAYVAISGEEILRASVEGMPLEDRPSPDRIFRCHGEDQWVVVDAVVEPDLRALGAAFACEASSTALAAVFLDREKSEVAAVAQELGIPAFPVLDAADLANDPHLIERGHMITVNLDGRDAHMPSLPFHGRPEIARFAQAAPAAGQHSEVVLREVLGYDAARVHDLLGAGAVVQS